MYPNSYKNTGSKYRTALKFNNDTNNTDSYRSNHKHRDPKINPRTHGEHKGITTHHEEFPMGKVYHSHHAKNNSQSYADKRKTGYCIQDLYQDD